MIWPVNGRLAAPAASRDMIRLHLDLAGQEKVGVVRRLRAVERRVMGHGDVEDADQLLPLAVDRDALGAGLAAENGEQAIGERIDVRDVRIGDEALIGRTSSDFPT